MVFPSTFPTDRKHETQERLVYDLLARDCPESWEIFYSKRFVQLGDRKNEFEVDFIIAIPRKCIIVLEVKGGMMEYDGYKWLQNGRVLNVNPAIQVSSATHALVKRYNRLAGDVEFIWMLCFPDCEIPHDAKMPPNLSRCHVLDANALFSVRKSIQLALEQRLVRNVESSSYYDRNYSRFRQDLLQDIGFVKTLSSTIRGQEHKLVQLSKQQSQIIHGLKDNKRIIVHGAAGSGKTVLAMQLAKLHYKAECSVLFLCYNRLLANRIRYTLGIREQDSSKLKISTFHSLARDLIHNSDTQWWESQDKRADDFWELQVPAKLDESIENGSGLIYDVIIIDEGQDFKEFWFETIFKLGNQENRHCIFLDSMQNIFGNYSRIPKESEYFTYHLTKNLRNTQSIVSYINQRCDTRIDSAHEVPIGDAVVEVYCKNDQEVIRELRNYIIDFVTNQGVQTSQLLILLDNSKDMSPISRLKAINSYPLKALDRQARFVEETIAYTQIESFKGLEQDVIFLLTSKATDIFLEKRYTQFSRAKHQLVILSIYE